MVQPELHGVDSGVQLSFSTDLDFSSGVGGGVYHPVGTALVSNVYPAEKAGPAISTLNFFGDVGKVLFPALAGILVIRIGWVQAARYWERLGLQPLFCISFSFDRISAQKGNRLHRGWKNRKVVAQSG